MSTMSSKNAAATAAAAAAAAAATEGTLKQISDSSALMLSREEPSFNLSDLFKKENSQKKQNTSNDDTKMLTV
jgi:hypothetical protein